MTDEIEICVKPMINQEFHQSKREKLQNVKIAGTDILVQQREAISLGKDHYFDFVMPDFAHIFLDGAKKHENCASDFAKIITIETYSDDISTFIASAALKKGKNPSWSPKTGRISRPSEENTDNFYDYMLAMSTSCIMAFSAVESFVNHQIERIPINDECLKKIKIALKDKKDEINSSFDIQRRVRTDDKIRKILPLLFDRAVGRDNLVLAEFKKLKDIRDGFIHLKSETYRQETLKEILPNEKKIPFRPTEIAAAVIVLFDKPAWIVEFLPTKKKK